jgi:hypothetical protein
VTANVIAAVDQQTAHAAARISAKVISGGGSLTVPRVRIQEVPQRHWDEFGAALAQFLATAPVMSRDHPASKHRIKQDWEISRK